MKKTILFWFFIFPFYLFAQINETFSDGNFTENPSWNGSTENFIINSSFQLQSKASATSKSYLSTPCESFDNATWEFWVKINYNPTSSNYVIVYLISDREDISNDCYGYYVQIGNTSDEISLYLKKGTDKIELIDGLDGRTNSSPAEVWVKVTRDKEGNFTLYSKLPDETDYYEEGTAKNLDVLGSKYFGLLYSNTSTTGNAYYFDNITVTGDKFVDVVPPVWTSLTLLEPNRLLLSFSEPVDFSNVDFEVNNGIGKPSQITPADDKKSVELTFDRDFEKGILYTVDISNLKDLSGNTLENTQKQTGIVEKTAIGDVVFNELLFEPAENIPEYFEIYNRSPKILDLTKLYFGTRKTDGTLNTLNYFPNKLLLLPHQYLAVTTNSEAVRSFYSAPDTALIANVEKWSALNNESGTLVLANQAGDTIFDEVSYNVKWHHPLVKITKGVSLEKINPALPSNDSKSWHSAASEVHYGTPGYKNSQFLDLSTDNKTKKWVWIEPEVFTPDNDGTNDLCTIHYQIDTNGYSANVIIFNAVGVKIKQLASNVLLSTEGFLTWDGSTDRGKNVNPGIYVLYFEMMNAETGVKKTEKLPIAVSAR